MTRLSFCLSLLLFAGSITLATADDKAPSTEPVNVSPDEAEKVIREASPIVIDIRTKDEFDEGHLQGAVNVDFLSPDFKRTLQTLDKNKTYLVYCQSGGRSGRSMKAFRDGGFTKIYHLNAGFGAWQAAGKPVSR